MEHTQAFRVAGTAHNINININVEQVQGQDVIFWEDIERVFPRAHLVQKGGAVINMLRDDNKERYVPLCIKHHPGEVLDVVLDVSPENVLDDPSIATSIMDLTLRQAGTSSNIPVNTSSLPSCPLSESISDLAVAPEPFSASSSAESELQQATQASANTTQFQSLLHSVTSAVVLASQEGTPLSSEQIMALAHAKLTSTSAIKTGFENTVNRKLDAIYDQGAMTQQIAIKVLQLQKQMNDRLILIQTKTEAILTQQLELAEYPIPRLFIVLPEEPTTYDPAKWFRTRFRLHFICECGEHTRASGSKISHHLHLAKHEGYVVREPTEFFKKYGPFLLLMLELIKFGSNIAGHVVPALANIKVSELIEYMQQPIATLTAKIDYSLECIDKQMGNVQEPTPRGIVVGENFTPLIQPDLANYLSNVEGVEGVELRQLGSFLKTSSKDNLLGNLYRMTTSDGHVKWVCRDHYRSGYQEAHTQKLRDVVQFAGGTFDEQLGKIDITLKSGFAAKEFYDALRKSSGVLELIIDLKWDFASKDVDALQDTLKKSLISILYVDLRQFQPDRYTALHRLLEPVNLISIHLILPDKLSSLSNFTPKRPPHLRHLTFEIVIGSEDKVDVRTLAEVLPAGSTWISLYLWDKSIQVKGVQGLLEAIKSSSRLTTLDLARYCIGENGVQALSEALRINSTLTTLNLETNAIGDKGTQLLAKAIRTNSTLKVLNLRSNWIKEAGAQALSEALKTNSTLAVLDLRSNEIGEKGAQAMSEAIKINPTLAALNFAANSIGERGAVALVKSIRTNSALIFLSLASNPIGEEGAQELSDALKINCTLATLDLWKCSIGDRGACALSEALAANSTLVTLNLDSTSIGNEGAHALANALITNLTLTTLYLASNSIKEEGAQSLSEALKNNSTLTLLDLSYNAIGPKGTQELSEALKVNSTLTTLNLDSNSITHKGVEVLSEALSVNSALVTLTLKSNSIDKKEAQALSKALKINSTLTTLGLDNNKIGDLGAQALCEALKINSTLATLGLDNNNIGDVGAQAFCEVLKINSTLMTLSLDNNNIGDAGAQAFCEALKSNSTLTILDLRDNSFGEEGIQALSEALNTNSNLNIHFFKEISAASFWQTNPGSLWKKAVS